MASLRFLCYFLHALLIVLNAPVDHIGSMRFRILQGLRKDQIYFVLALGIGNGIYTWNSVLKEHIKECEKELQLNEVISDIVLNDTIITCTIILSYISRLFNTTFDWISARVCVCVYVCGWVIITIICAH